MNIGNKRTSLIYFTIEGDFNRIIKYGEMKEIKIKQEENYYFENVMKQLGNNLEFSKFSKEFQGNISFDNVIQRIKTKNELNIKFDIEIS